jgi:hypothetical protein
MPDEATCARFVQLGVKMEPAALTALSGTGEPLSSAHLTDGRTVAIDALYLTPHSRLNSPLAERLGCALDECPFGPVIRVDAAKMRTVLDVHGAGDIARAPHSVSWAVADGATTGMSVHQALAFASLAT